MRFLITGIGLAAFALLVRDAISGAWSLQPAVRGAIAIGMVVLAVWVWWRQSGSGTRLAASAALLATVAAALPLAQRPMPVERWRSAEEERLRRRFEMVRTTLGATERRARSIGDAALELAADSTSRTVDNRAQLFADLQALVEPGRKPETWPATAGIQLFDTDGGLLAWAGSPRAIATRERRSAPSRPISFRQSGVYTLLTYERWSAGDSLGTRVVVDVPIEVQFDLNNRFLKSRSLARELSGDGVEVSLILNEVPLYTSTDDLDLHGDEHHWIRGESLLRDTDGAPLALCRLDGLPYVDAAERTTQRTRLWVRVLLVAAASAASLAAGLGLRAAAGRLQRTLVSPAAILAALWGLRWLVAAFELPPGRLGSSVFNPAAFAMVGFGGILRSPFDLLLTAIVLAATAILLFGHAARRWRQRWDVATPVSRGSHALRLVLALAVVFVATAAVFRFVGRVVGDSNPFLIGPRLDLTAPAVLCLHAGLLVGVAAALALAILAVHALLGPVSRRTLLLPAALVLGFGLGSETTWLVGLVGALVLWSGARLRTLLADERFTSFGLATFLLVALTAALDTEAIQGEYFRNQQVLVRERAAEISSPGDDLRRFVVEEMVEKLRDETWIARALLSERSAEISPLAFRIWAQSLLSHLGYSSQVRIYDEFGRLASEFTVDLPQGSEAPARDMLERVRSTAESITIRGVRESAAGSTQYYSGATAVRDDAENYCGAIIVDVPFANTSLELAANPRRRAPELLLNLQEEGIGPRVEDSERLLLAWIENGVITESSTPYLSVGAAPVAASAEPGAWRELALLNGRYWVTRAGDGPRALLAGFRRPSTLDRVQQWSQIASFDFACTMLGLLLFLGLARIPVARRALPSLLVPKRLGFQQKLMMAFLIVSLLPSVVISVATRDIMRDRSQQRNRDAVLVKARSARAALADLVRRDLDAVRESEYLRAIILASEQPPVRDIGHLELSHIMVFRSDSTLILDETLSNLSDEQAREFVRRAPRDIFASRDGGQLSLGALEPVWFSPTEGLSESAADAQLYYVYFRRQLTDRLLRNLSPILNTDISGFVGPHLAVSSQRSLATAGLLPTLVPPEAFANLTLRRNRDAVVEESAGRQRYYASYLPLEDLQGRRIGALSASQVLQADEVAVEVERTQALILGLSTLLFLMTLVLGVVFAARIFDPVRSLIEGTRRIAGGDLTFRLRARAGDEIGELERSFNDMAARLQAARWALEERRRYLEAVLGHIASGVIATDAEGCITAANPAAYRILQLEAGSLEGRRLHDLKAAPATPGVRVFWGHLEMAEAGLDVEVPLERDESRFVLRVIVTDLLAATDASSRLGRVAIFEDVSELIRSKKLAAWAEMARQVAHEIKNPLTPMKLSAQFMEQAYRDDSDQFPQIFREGMRTIIEQVDNLRRIASEFSNFGRVQKLRAHPLDLGLLLQRVTAPYRGMDGLEFVVEDGAEGRFPGSGLLVLGDEDGLRKVFTNVLENAREALGGRGCIRLGVETPAEGRVRVRITDSGAGLSDEAAHRLFEPYFSTKTTGTGLGLAITRSILEELGGSITLDNPPQGGAEARITLVLCS